jgi:opine dehydrogenase
MTPTTSPEQPSHHLTRIAVLGAGGGGRASAYMLATHGLAVRLWEAPAYAANLQDLQGGLCQENAPAAAVPLDLVTTDLPAAIDGADLIVSCVQRGSHRLIGEQLAGCMRQEQTLLLNPGSLGGALEIARIFRDHGRGLPRLGETSTLTHCARPVPGGIRTRLTVRHVFLAALPATDTPALLETMRPYYLHLVPAQSVLETGLYNGNPVLHPAIALLNAGALERNDGSFRFYGDGVTPAVARLIEAVDRERQTLAAAYGLKLIPEPVLSVMQGYAEHDDYLRCYRDSAIFAPLLAPDTLDHRYLHEDVGEGLVTWLALAELAGIRLPLVEAMLTVAETITGQDYRSGKAERLARLGLEGWGREEVLAYVHSGRRN